MKELDQLLDKTAKREQVISDVTFKLQDELTVLADFLENVAKRRPPGNNQILLCIVTFTLSSLLLHVGMYTHPMTNSKTFLSLELCKCSALFSSSRIAWVISKWVVKVMLANW